VVTGTSRGLGRSIALELAKEAARPRGRAQFPVGRLVRPEK